jgi:asparagine synthase (glutamine-hydrolysing)
VCGIAGIVAAEAERYHGHLQRMIASLGHRGPDESGSYFFKNCALGHTRLSVVDLSTGQQPMLSPVDPVGITFNGEIYGYKSYRASLGDFPFRTTSDTEVILALYQRYGVKMFSRLPGMFAFAIWDHRRQELLCARDRFGEKPFFYAFGREGEFIFASEIKALLASGLVEPVLNRDAVAHYLKYLYVHPHKTVYRNIHTLPPAHLLRYRDGRESLERYWHLPEPRNDIEITEAAEELARLFDQAVSACLVADVPVAAFLSGGLDSSTVVAIASRHQARLKTFSFGFADTLSELPFARQVADLYKTEHVEIADQEADIGALLVAMQDIFDEPFADSSNIPTYLISRSARQHTKVALTGDGADELLAGYSFWYNPLLNMQEAGGKHAELAFFFRVGAKLARRAGVLWNTTVQHKLEGIEYRRRYRSVVQAHAAQRQYFTDHEISQFGLDPATKSLTGPACDTIDDALRMDIEDYMPGDILVKLDRASMANGLELRAPFLDVDFASFCISLPYRLKINTEHGKLILRRAMANFWPPSVRTRGKQGFGAPVNQWLKRDTVKVLKEQYLNDRRQKLFSLLPFERTRSAVNHDDYKTWILLVLALWLDEHEFNLA